MRKSHTRKTHMRKARMRKKQAKIILIVPVILVLIVIVFLLLIRSKKTEDMTVSNPIINNAGSKSTENNNIEVEETEKDTLAVSKTDISTYSTYTDEENKTVSYGDLHFKLNNYHITSMKENTGDIEYTLKGDNGSLSSDEEFSFSIKESNRPQLKSIDDMIVYAESFFKNYDDLKVFYDISDDYGMVGFFFFFNNHEKNTNKQANYLIFYPNKTYEIENTSIFIMSSIYSNSYEPSYEHEYKEFSSENATLANMEGKYFYSENKAEITVTQSKTNTKHFIEIISNETGHTIEVKNSDGQVLIHSMVVGDDCYNEFIKVSDLNGDGYGDLEIMSAQGARNNVYNGYIYNQDNNDFTDIGELEI